MPFFNRSINEDLILAIQSAGVSRDRNGFFLRYATKALRDNRKDKSGEPLARCNLIAAKARRIGGYRQSRLRGKNTCSNTAPTAPTRFLPFGRSYFVVDTLYIGAEKFPCREAFSISTSGGVAAVNGEDLACGLEAHVGFASVRSQNKTHRKNSLTTTVSPSPSAAYHNFAAVNYY